MDDKTKVELCKKMIEEYLWETGGGKPGELLVILDTAYAVLEFEEENDG